MYTKADKLCTDRPIYVYKTDEGDVSDAAYYLYSIWEPSINSQVWGVGLEQCGGDLLVRVKGAAAVPDEVNGVRWEEKNADEEWVVLASFEAECYYGELILHRLLKRPVLFFCLKCSDSKQYYSCIW